MPLTMTAAFSSRQAAGRAQTLLRQHGISATQKQEQQQPGTPFTPYPFDINGKPTAPAEPPKHALLLNGPVPGPASTVLTLAADPSQVAAARAIVFRCGGRILVG